MIHITPYHSNYMMDKLHDIGKMLISMLKFLIFSMCVCVYLNKSNAQR